jgi:hypothetical protein
VAARLTLTSLKGGALKEINGKGSKFIFTLLQVQEQEHQQLDCAAVLFTLAASRRLFTRPFEHIKACASHPGGLNPNSRPEWTPKFARLSCILRPFPVHVSQGCWSLSANYLPLPDDLAGIEAFSPGFQTVIRRLVAIRERRGEDGEDDGEDDDEDEDAEDARDMKREEEEDAE